MIDMVESLNAVPPLNKLTQARVRELLDYNPETGELRWKVLTSNRAKIGDVAGCSNTPDGYRRIGVDGKMYLAHRLAWLHTHGHFPDILDHVNCVRSDNRLTNLRPATIYQNNMNRPRNSNNSSGIKGVSFHKPSGKWRADIMVHGKNYHLGTFKTIEEATAARQGAAALAFGEFAHEHDKVLA